MIANHQNPVFLRPEIAPLRLQRSDGKWLELDGKTCAVMGIVNLTPDSFSDGGNLFDPGPRCVVETLVAQGPS